MKFQLPIISSRLGYTSVDDWSVYSSTSAPKRDGLSIRLAGRSNSFANPGTRTNHILLDWKYSDTAGKLELEFQKVLVINYF